MVNGLSVKFESIYGQFLARKNKKIFSRGSV